MDATCPERMVAMAVPAAAEAVGDLPSSFVQRIPLRAFIGVPAPVPGKTCDRVALEEAVRRAIVASGIDVGRIEIVEGGHAAGMAALAAAWTVIAEGDAELALAGGIDCHLDPETLEWLESCDQVHSAGFANNPYGFIPGEACGFVLLAAGTTARQHALDGVLEVAQVAQAFEEARIKTDAVCTGQGLTALFATLSSSGLRPAHLYADLNGEPYRSDEFGFATVRHAAWAGEPCRLETPADCWGDVGAASGPLFLILAEASMRRGYASGTVTAAFTSSEDGERRGFVARRVDARGAPC
jgi:3-oxoacyl-[acyl-carrier-protein] synthase-1